MVVLTDGVEFFQFLVGVECSYFRREGDVHHARLHHVLMVVVGQMGFNCIGHLPGCQFTVG